MALLPANLPKRRSPNNWPRRSLALRRVQAAPAKKARASLHGRAGFQAPSLTGTARSQELRPGVTRSRLHGLRPCRCRKFQVPVITLTGWRTQRKTRCVKPSDKPILKQSLTRGCRRGASKRRLRVTGPAGFLIPLASWLASLASLTRPSRDTRANSSNAASPTFRGFGRTAYVVQKPSHRKQSSIASPLTISWQYLSASLSR